MTKAASIECMLDAWPSVLTVMKAARLTSSPTNIVEFETIDSTNTEAHRRAVAGERGPLWIRSDRQEQGRGRSGRPWSSPPGNLSATYLFTPSCARSVLHQLSFVAGLAAFDAVAPHLGSGAPLQLKWPNDVLIGDAKVGGILVESANYDGDIVVIIGMGINIAVTPDIEDRAVTQIDVYGAAPKPSELIQVLAQQMQSWLAQWRNGDGFPDVRKAWLRRAHAIGQRLTVNTNDRQLAGTFAGLADNGALLLATGDGAPTRIEHGDVSLASTPPMPEKH